MTSQSRRFRAPRARARALSAALIITAMLLLGAVSAQAKPGDPPVDFLLQVDASSASFTPSADTPGAYELVLRGVPDEVGVTELTRARTTASLPVNAFMAYWTAYGDETGQFEANPPRAVLQAADAAGTLQEVVVRLSDGSRRGSTLRFDAEIVSSENVQNVLDAKVDEVVQTEPPGEPVLVTEPTTLADVELFVDMPQRIAQPEVEADERTLAAARLGHTIPPWAGPTRVWMPNGGTCNGIYSSQLRNCWENIPAGIDGWPCNHSGNQGLATGFNRFVDGRGIAVGGAGEVDLAQYFWNHGLPGAYRPRLELSRCFRHWNPGDWYGVHRDGSTFYVTDRCTWFMARWSADGRCW